MASIRMKFVHARGFTLLELLVVIAIIGILVSIGSASYLSVQKKARDTKRRSDVGVIGKAFEQYYADVGKYPLSGTCDPGTTYLPAGIPTDPKTGVAYTPTCTASGTTFCACATLEQIGSGNATNTSCTYGAGDYFCVRNVQ